MISITAHGVRGSVPTTGQNFSKYGGNTSCFEINTKDSQIFIDAGTGFALANINEGSKRVFLLFTHLHHDHLQGLLFNSQLFTRNQEIIVCSALMTGASLRQHLSNYFSPPFFPPNVFSHINCLKFLDFESFAEQVSPGVTVDYVHLKHPGGAIGYSFKTDSRKVVIALDNEFDSDQETELCAFCENADILIWDGMYTDAEIVDKKGWGHSTVEQAVYFTKKANVKKTIICHHSPARSDDKMDSMRSLLFEQNVEFGTEGTTFSL